MGTTSKGNAAILTNLTSITPSEKYLTPEMYGAKGDGVADDAPAINNAIKAAANGENGEPCIVRFSEKTYRIESQIDVKSNVTLVGDNTTLYKPNFITTKDGQIKDQPAGVAWGHRIFSCVKIENVVIDGFRLDPECNASTSDSNHDDYKNLLSSSSPDVKKRETEIADTYKTYSNAYGMRIDNSCNITVRNVTMNDCMYGFFIIGSSDIKITDCRIDGDTVDLDDGTQRGGLLYGMYITQSNEVNVSNTYIAASIRANNHHHDIYIGANCQKVYFENCKFRAKGEKPVSFKQGTGQHSTNEDGTLADSSKPSTDIHIMNSSFRIGSNVAYVDNGGEVHFQNCNITTTSVGSAFTAVNGSTISLTNNYIYCPRLALSFGESGTYKVFNNYFKCFRILSANNEGAIDCSIENCVFDCIKPQGETGNSALLFFNCKKENGEPVPWGTGKINVTNNTFKMHNFDPANRPINTVNKDITLSICGNTFINNSDEELYDVVNNTVSAASVYYNNIAIGFGNFAITTDIGTSVGNIVA